MAPKLRVLVSSSSAYPPTAPITVNSSTPTPISTPGFEGNVWVFVKDYAGDHKEGDGKEYFEEDGRGGMTYGIVVKGALCLFVTDWKWRKGRTREAGCR